MWMRKGRTQAGQVAGSKTDIASKKTNTEAKGHFPRGLVFPVTQYSVFGGGDFSYSVFSIQYSMGEGGALETGLAH